jgi:alpha-N-arabinofuranosidase
VPAIEAVATLDQHTRDTTLFLVNRSRHTIAVAVDARPLGEVSVTELLILADDDLKVVNTEAEPDRVSPRVASWECDGESVEFKVPKVSFAMLRLAPI